MPVSQSAQHKQQLRRHLRQIRLALTTQQVQQNSQAIIKQLINSDVWRQSQHIAIYLPINNEVDLSALLAHQKTFYLPTIENQEMQFHPYHVGLELNKTSFGLSQPKFIPDYKSPTIDLCLMPLLGFDNQGHRLGMGGGYYDRYFEDPKDTLLLGVAHAVQELEKLPIEPWDVTLQGILTEQQWMTI